MGHFLQLVLDVHLQLHNLLSVLWMVDLLGHFRGFLVHTGLEQALSMVKLVLDHVRVELSQLIVHVGCASVVLNVEVAVGEQGKGSPVSGAEL